MLQTGDLLQQGWGISGIESFALGKNDTQQQMVSAAPSAVEFVDLLKLLARIEERTETQLVVSVPLMVYPMGAQSLNRAREQR